VKGEYKSFPRAGRFWNYQEKNRMMIPMEGEVEWQMPDRNSPYWKGKIVETQYVFAQWIAPKKRMMEQSVDTFGEVRRRIQEAQWQQSHV